MKKIILFFFFPLIFLSQNNNFVIGINGGLYLANQNTSIQYNGNYNSYGVSSIFSNPLNQITFDQFFQYPYYIYDIPSDIKYNPASEIGFHIGWKKKKSKYYMDMNFSDIKIQDFITIAVDNPNNLSPEPNYEPVSITGNEKRNMINLGVQKKIYEESKISLFYPIFLQLLEVKIVENFITINNQQYNIIHNFQSSTNINQNQGRIGLGFGSGLIVNYFANKDVSFEFGYHIQYSKTNFSENLNPWGIQNSIFARIVLNGSKYLSNSNN